MRVQITEPNHELPLFEVRHFRTLENQPGCYCVVNLDGIPLYIGRSINLYDRIRSHFIRTYEGELGWACSGITARFVPMANEDCWLQIWISEQYVELERLLIGYHEPLHNRKLNKVRYVNRPTKFF